MRFITLFVLLLVTTGCAGYSITVHDPFNTPSITISNVQVQTVVPQKDIELQPRTESAGRAYHP